MTLFNVFLMDSAAKILLKYVKNNSSRGNSRSSIQLDPKFDKKILFKFLIADTLGSYSMVKNCETYIFPKERYSWLISVPHIQLFKLYKIRHLSVDSDTCVFLWETPWNRPTGIITFFVITHEGVDHSFSSSNSTEISMRWFYAQNFITIGLVFEELSC